MLIEDWCQQYPSHSVGSLAFGPDGSLYVSGGDGASFNFVDYGQAGSPRNPCGDPPAGVGGVQRPGDIRGRGAARPGGAHLGRPDDRPAGSIMRIDPDTGAPMPDNPLITLPDTGRAAGWWRTASGTPSASPSGPAPTSCGWVTWAGTRIEEVDRTVGNDAVARQLRLAVLRGRPDAGRRPGQPGGADVRVALRPGHRGGDGPDVRLRPPARRSRPVRPATSRPGQPSLGWPGRQGHQPLPRPSRQVAVLRRRHTPLHLADAADHGRPSPTRPRSRLFASDRPGPSSTCSSGRAARSGTPTSTEARSGGSGTRPPTTRPSPCCSATPTSGDPPLTVTFDASASHRPGRG